MSKQDELAIWCANRKVFSKADLMQYGLDNWYLRAWRTLCEFVVEGRARKLKPIEIMQMGKSTKMGWYAWLEQPARQAFEKKGQMAFIA